MKKRNLLHVFLIGLAALSAIIGIGMINPTEVRADDTFYEDEAVLTKELKIPEGVLVPDLSFEFTATPLGTEDEDGIIDASEIVNQPAWSIPAINFGSPDKGTTNDNFVRSTTNLLADIKALNFSHAGTFVYEVFEVTPDTKSKVISHYSEALYTVRVYVENGDDGNPVVKGITVYQVKKDDGTPGGYKVDPTPGSVTLDGGSEFRFVNEFWDETELEVEKRVAGNAGDRTKAFDFKITVTLPETTKKDFELTYTTPSGSDPDSPIIYDESTRIFEIDVKLKHGEKISFDNLPVGSTYNVVETIAKGYEPSAVVTGRGTNGVATDGTPDDDLKFTVEIGGISDLLVDAEDVTAQTPIKNTTVVTNEYKDPSITGVLTDNFPFIVMVLVAGVGIVFLTVSKRRRAQ